jgi:DNA-directed RNA polymerase specialized sigma24 family protein
MPHDLDPSSLHALLDALQTSNADAGSAYEQLRVKLERFFRWNGCRVAEVLADQAMDRLAGRLAADPSVITDPARFALGIARMMVYEDRIRESRETKAHAGFASETPHAPDDAEQARAEALDRCLNALPPRSRRLIDRYYTGDAGERIRNRQQIAAELGLDLNALRNRALRLRKQLASCVERRLGDTTGKIHTGGMR